VIEATAVVEEPSLFIQSARIYIGHFVQIRPGVVMGDGCSIRAHCVLEACELGRNVKIMQLCNITEGAKIADDVFIGPGVVMVNTNRICHTRNFELVKEGPIIGRGVRIGGGAVIGPGVTIGENALIGMGSVVTRDVPAGECWVGNPARFMRMVPKEELL